MFYATLETPQETVYCECHGEVEIGSIDLRRFETKKERDEFIASFSSGAEIISSKDAREQHKEQFRYWQGK